jgi:osmotically-inducible protein OsmY
MPSSTHVEKIMSDKQLKQSVLAELAWEPSVPAAHIGVAVHEGVVTLTGHVTNFIEKHMAEAAVGRVKGVKAVAEEIEVRLPFDNQRGDEEIAAAAVTRLEWDACLSRSAVKVQVEGGWLTLVGQVDWHYQREAAGWDVRGLRGVVGVSNQITIKPRVDAANLSDNIMHALHRSWFFDPKTITVTADGGNIKLSGTAHSWQDRQVAADTAWAAPGASAVENNISVV